ncbi:MAG TPA: HD domain-containing protein [Dehalococcoidia bacterium]|nr:HD domain-containing protein [Dehalococcoidia bacterium]
MLRRARYRAGQFFGALRVRLDPAELAEARALLGDRAWALFRSMDPRDQRHGLDVWRMLREDAADDRDLQVAALLHDCGKGRQSVWTRVAHVALQNVAPGLERRIARPGGALDRLLRHPEIGAERAREAGCGPEVVRLIREQESAAPDPRLALLQRADELN